MDASFSLTFGCMFFDMRRSLVELGKR